MDANRNWHRIEDAPRGAGPLLLRAGPGLADPAYVGYLRDDGRWIFSDQEVHPTHWCLIPGFDADAEAAS